MENEALWGWERELVVFNIHQNNTNWTTKILEAPFSYVFEKVLTPTERRITYMKIDGLVDGEVAIRLKIQLSTVKRHIYNIRKKYRLQENWRVDNSPAYRKHVYHKTEGKKGFILRKPKHEKN